jgi:hypothetical protein
VTAEPIAATHAPDSPPDGHDQARFDLRALFRAIGHTPPTTQALSNDHRAEASDTVTLIDPPACVAVDAEALAVAGFVDGIQSQLVVAWRAHRPVTLVFVAAAALTAPGSPTAHDEELFLLCSVADRDWVDEISSGVQVVEVASVHPPEVERAVGDVVGARRARIEHRLVRGLRSRSDRPVVVDGDLRAYAERDGLCGVVKSSATRYLDDETLLYGLPAGWRSPRFRIGADRFSCYVRLAAAHAQPWHFGLVRLEASDPDLLDPLAARCLAERQPATTGDARWDRHLVTVRACEDYLRVRRPAVFTVRR